MITEGAGDVSGEKENLLRELEELDSYFEDKENRTKYYDALNDREQMHLDMKFIIEEHGQDVISEVAFRDLLHKTLSLTEEIITPHEEKERRRNNILNQLLEG